MITDPITCRDMLKGQTAISVAGLRELLYGLSDQDQMVHIVTKEKYGEVISTGDIAGIRLHIDRDGKNHITFTT